MGVLSQFEKFYQTYMKISTYKSKLTILNEENLDWQILSSPNVSFWKNFHIWFKNIEWNARISNFFPSIQLWDNFSSSGFH